MFGGERPSFLGDDEEQLVTEQLLQAVSRAEEEREKRQNFLNNRRGPLGIRLGASDLPAAVGISQYGPRPYSLYERMRAELEGTPMKRDYEYIAAAEHGHRCEPLVAAELARRLNMVSHETELEVHYCDRELDAYMSCNVDRHMIEAGAPYEEWLRSPDSSASNHSERYRRWKDCEIKSPYGQMYRQVKDEHRVQVLGNMFLTGKREQYYAVGHYPHAEDDKHSQEPKGAPTHPYPPYKPLDSYDQLLAFRCWDIPYDASLMHTFVLPRIFYLIACVVTQQPPPVRLYDGEPPHGFSREFYNSNHPAFRWAKPDGVLPAPTRGCEILEMDTTTTTTTWPSSSFN